MPALTIRITATGTSKVMPKAMNIDITNDRYCSMSGAGTMLLGANSAMNLNTMPNTKK